MAPSVITSCARLDAIYRLIALLGEVWVARSRHFHTEEGDYHSWACGEVANLPGDFGAYFAGPLIYWVSVATHDKMERSYLILVEPCHSPCCRHCTVDLEGRNHYCNQDEEIRVEKEPVDTLVADTLVDALLAEASFAVGQDVLHYQE